MADEKQVNLADRWLASLKNRPFVAMVVVVAAIVAGLGAFLKSANEVRESLGLKAQDPTQLTAELLHGAWNGTTRLTSPDGQVCLFEGSSSFLESRTYNFRGEVRCHKIHEGKNAEISCLATAAGTWQVSKTRLIVVLIDYKTTPQRFKMEGEPDIDYTKQPTNGRSICFRDDTPSGSSQDYDIDELTKSVLRFHGKGRGGSIIQYQGRKERS